MAGEPCNAEIQSAIADILRDGELTKLTSRIVRAQLEVKFGVSFLGSKHISTRTANLSSIDLKKEIDKMLMEMIENQEKSTEDEKEQENGTNEVNGIEQNESNQEDDDSSEDDEPPPKKIKQEILPSKEPIKAESDSDEGTDDVNDAELARKLHENEKGLRARRQATKKPVERKKIATAKKPKTNTGEKKGFGKLMVLSPVLAEVVGQDKMARSDVVKKMWEVIRERQLEDPKNKRFTICDEQLQQVFGRKRILTFAMMKYLKKHIKDPALIL